MRNILKRIEHLFRQFLTHLSSDTMHTFHLLRSRTGRNETKPTQAACLFGRDGAKPT